MTKMLQKALEEASRLPPDEQDALAARILEEIDSERRWDELFSKSPHVLEKLAEEAKAELRAGLTEPLDPDKL
jgi:hypothetical protein